MELNTTNDTSRVEAVTRFAGSFGLTDRDPGAHAPGFMPWCAPRTGLLKNRKIAGLTPGGFRLKLLQFHCGVVNLAALRASCIWRSYVCWLRSS
jgi:hypothetical protein